MLVNLIVRNSVIIGVITSPLRNDLPTAEVNSLSDIKVGYDTYDGTKVVSQDAPKSVKDKERIVELKKLLASTDYLCLKHADGELTDEEYASVKAQRHAWRVEINELEA